MAVADKRFNRFSAVIYAVFQDIFNSSADFSTASAGIFRSAHVCELGTIFSIES